VGLVKDLLSHHAKASEKVRMAGGLGLGGFGLTLNARERGLARYI